MRGHLHDRSNVRLTLSPLWQAICGGTYCHSGSFRAAVNREKSRSAAAVGPRACEPMGRRVARQNSSIACNHGTCAPSEAANIAFSMSSREFLHRVRYLGCPPAAVTPVPFGSDSPASGI